MAHIPIFGGYVLLNNKYIGETGAIALICVLGSIQKKTKRQQEATKKILQYNFKLSENKCEK